MFAFRSRRAATATAAAALIVIAGSAVQQAPIMLGAQPDGAVIVPTNQTVSPVGLVRLTEGERPKDMAISPDGALVAVRTHTGVRLYARDGREIGSIKRGAGPLGIAWTPDGRSIVTGDPAGKLVWIDVRPGAPVPLSVGRETPLETLAAAMCGPAPSRSAQITGIAIAPDGTRVYAGLGIRNAVAVVEAATGRLLNVAPVGICPYRITLSPDGGTLYAANRGGPLATDAAATALSAGTPAPIDRRTDAALRGSVSILDTATMHAAEVAVGRQPSAIACSRDGRTVYIANSDDDTVSVLDARARKVTATFALRPAADPGFGQMPSALALSGDGSRLYVACGGANAIAVVNLGGAPAVAGWIPAGWYPIAVEERGGALIIASAKGIGARPARPTPRYGVHDSVGCVQFASAADLAPLDALTRTVGRNNRWGAEQPARRGIAAVPVPERVGEPSVFRHVVYIIKENHTYDSTLGDMPEGNGDPSLCLFGESVTPNQHALARDFVLLDNTFTSGTNSADGHQWTSSSIANDYMERNYSASARSYPYDGGDPLAYSPAGFLWTAAARSRVGVRVYGEFVNRPQIVDTTAAGPAANPGGRGADQGAVAPTRRRAGTWTDIWRDYRSGGHRFSIRAETDNAALRPHLHPRFIGFPQIVSDQWRADQYLADLAGFERTGRMPGLSILLLPNDHTSGTSPGMPTPRAAVADNDLALGRIVEGISRSRFWKDTLILVIEDDSQLGIDHVDGHRTIAFCVSPYTRRRTVVHEPYNHTSLIRTMELALGIPALNRFDRTATPMTACFTATPDTRPYTAIPNRVPLDEMNPAVRALRGSARRLAAASARQDWSDVDRADPAVVARAVWASRRPGQPFPVDRFHPPADRD